MHVELCARTSHDWRETQTNRRQLSPLLKVGMAGAEGPDHKLLSAWVGKAKPLASGHLQKLFW